MWDLPIISDRPAHPGAADSLGSLTQTEPPDWLSFFVEANVHIPIHHEASEASTIVGLLNPGSVVYGYYADEAWVCIVDRSDHAYFVKVEHLTPFSQEMSDISIFQDDHEVIADGFSIHTNTHSVSGMTLEEITYLLQAYPSLQGIEESVLLYERKYGVNAYFILAVASQESGFGTSLLANRKNNLFGIGAYDDSAFESALEFSSKAQSVEYFCILIARYRENGRTTPTKINETYASDELWAHRIAQLMRSYASRMQARAADTK